MCGEQLVISSDIVAVRARQRRLSFHHATVLPPKYQAQRPPVFLVFGALVFVFFLSQKVRNNFAAGFPLYGVGNDDLNRAFLCRRLTNAAPCNTNYAIAEFHSHDTRRNCSDNKKRASWRLIFCSSDPSITQIWCLAGSITLNFPPRKQRLTLGLVISLEPACVRKNS